MMKWIRWNGLAAFIVLVAVVAAIWLVAVDWVAKKAIEAAGTKAVGAKVELAKADVTLFPAGIGIWGMAVTDPDRPMTNSVEFAYLHAALQLPALIQRKVVIDDLRVEGLQLNTPRKTSGAIEGPKTDADSSEDASNSQPGWITDLCGSANLPLISVPKVEEILAREPLQSVKEIQALESRIETAAKEWQKKLDSLPDQKALSEYQARAEAIKGSGKSLGNLLGSAAEAQALARDLKRDLEQIETVRKEFKTEYTSMEKAVNGLSKLPSEELKRLMNKYSLTADGAANWSRLLFGHSLCGWWQKVYHWYQRFAPYLSRLPAGEDEPQTQQPLRSKGLDVRFQEKNPVPDLLIRQTHVDAKLEVGEFSGQINNITSHPQIVGQPLTFKFLGRRLQRVEGINLNGMLDFVRPQSPNHTAKLNIQGYRIEDLLLGADTLDLVIKQGAADLQLDFNLKEAVTNARLVAKLGQLTFDAPKEHPTDLAAAVIDAIRGTSDIDLEATLKGREPQYETSLKSDIAGAVHKAAGRLVKRQAAQLETRLRTAVNEKLKAPIKDAQNRMAGLDAVGSELLKRSQIGNEMLKQLKLPL
jgi:uncharacterized protein (TIGR03545 family)